MSAEIDAAVTRAALAQPKCVARPPTSMSPDQTFHRRDKLLGLFWPGRDQEHDRAAPRKELYFLCQVVVVIVFGR